MNLCLRQADQCYEPFEYVLFDQVFSTPAIDVLLAWMKTTIHWQLAETDFYEQYEFSIDDITLPSSIKFLNNGAFRSSVSKVLESSFGSNLGGHGRLVAHKLLAGQHIGIHNDVTEGGESFRFTIQINDGLEEKDGGFFLLFNSERGTDVHRILRPANNSAIAFKISEKSNHAVSKMHGGVRYSLVFSFDER